MNEQQYIESLKKHNDELLKMVKDMQTILDGYKETISTLTNTLASLFQGVEPSNK